MHWKVKIYRWGRVDKEIPEVNRRFSMADGFTRTHDKFWIVISSKEYIYNHRWIDEQHIKKIANNLFASHWPGSPRQILISLYGHLKYGYDNIDKYMFTNH